MQVGAGTRRYETVEDCLSLPEGFAFGQVVQVIVDRQDRVLFFHRGTPGVVIFSKDGAYLGAWEDGGFQDIHSAYLANDSDGEYLLIVDRNRNALARTTLDGEKVWEVESDLFDRPTDAAVAANGEIYVSDGYGNARVHVFSAEGKLLRSWGEPGAAAGQFQLPHGVCLIERDGGECAYVCDRENRRIQVFTAEGDFITELTDLRRPTDVIVDDEGVRYVSELEHRVTILGPDDAVIAHIGGESKAAPGFFVAPHSVALDSEGALYVTEVLEGQRVQKFRRV